MLRNALLCILVDQLMDAPSICVKGEKYNDDPSALPPPRHPSPPSQNNDSDDNRGGGGVGQDTSHFHPIPESLVNTLSWLRKAIELDPSSYDAWHAWALMNYQLAEVRVLTACGDVYRCNEKNLRTAVFPIMLRRFFR